VKSVGLEKLKVFTPGGEGGKGGPDFSLVVVMLPIDGKECGKVGLVVGL
jgi:hypothetical protein